MNIGKDPSPWIGHVTHATSRRRLPAGWPMMSGIAAVAVICLMSQPVYTIEPTELAFTRTFGRVDQAPTPPVGPKAHLKLPCITHVDRLQVSVDTISPPGSLRVLSHEGQVILLGVSSTWRIPAAAVYGVLYGTGSVGDVDIDRNIFSIVSDRTMTIFGREDVLDIATERERIIGEMKTVISRDLQRLFGVDLIDLQITGFRFSPEYEHAVNENTLAKTNAYRAEQVIKQRQADAEQAAADAKGFADAAIEKARSQSHSTLLNAAADAKATVVQASADASAIKLRVEAAGGADGYTKVMAADTLKRWNGKTPQTVLGGNSSPFPFLQSTR